MKIVPMPEDLIEVHFDDHSERWLAYDTGSAEIIGAHGAISLLIRDLVEERPGQRIMIMEREVG